MDPPAVNNDETSADKPPPSYGSKSYWDQRYEKLLVQDPDKQRAPPANNDDGPDAFHSWYFSYEDLKPIILALILGGKEEADRLVLSRNSEDENDSCEAISEKQVNPADAPPDPSNDISTSLPPNESEQRDCTTNKQELDENNSDKEDGWEEVDGDDDSVDGEEDEEVSQTETGMSIEGPCAILEVGCGDVPLVLGLAKDLESLQGNLLDDDKDSKNMSSKPFVNCIVCTDYSETLVSTLKRMQQKKRKCVADTDKDQTSTATIGTARNVRIEYLVADARNLPFPDRSFHLILEKGTMDAMISDAEVGVSNCIKIVSDCARTLAIGGCFFLVSHINAHTVKGEEWLNNVVLTGLRNGGDNATWYIEVHGNEQGQEDDDDDNDSSEHPEASGPAVYLIFKGPPPPMTEEESNEPPSVPLKFFCY